MGQLHLELHPEKTRLIEFGRFARSNRQSRGEGKPETFDFLGFTHICGQSRKGKFLLHRHSVRKRFRAKLKELKDALKQRRHDPRPSVGAWLRSVFVGYANYHAVPTNLHTIRALRREMARMWFDVLRRRSQVDTTTWQRFRPLLDRWIPAARCLHPLAACSAGDAFDLRQEPYAGEPHVRI
jgi:RNA-directed DNA polymerase